MGLGGLGGRGVLGKLGIMGRLGVLGGLGVLGDGGLEIWSEGVTDGKVEGQGVLEGCHVVVAAFAGVVGGMDSDAEVGAEYEHGDVETESHTGAEGDVLEECGGFQLPAGAEWVFLQQPDVARVDEYGAVERADYREAVFGVKLELECTCLVEIAVALVSGGTV